MTDEQLRAAVLYVADQCREDEGWGRTKLQKIFFFADLHYFRRHLRTATGLTYIKREYGPFSPGLHALSRNMVREGLAEERKVPRGDRESLVLLPTQRPNPELVPEDFRAALDAVIADLADRSAGAISDATHQLAAWRLARPEEEINLSWALVARRRPTESSIRWAQDRIRQEQER